MKLINQHNQLTIFPGHNDKEQRKENMKEIQKLWRADPGPVSLIRLARLKEGGGEGKVEEEEEKVKKEEEEKLPERKKGLTPKI